MSKFQRVPNTSTVIGQLIRYLEIQYKCHIRKITHTISQVMQKRLNSAYKLDAIATNQYLYLSKSLCLVRYIKIGQSERRYPTEHVALIMQYYSYQSHEPYFLSRFYKELYLIWSLKKWISIS